MGGGIKQQCLVPELAKSIGIGIGFLSCIGIGNGIVKRRFSKYWYWYC